jgi:flagellar biosynthesis regulator FlaF
MYEKELSLMKRTICAIMDAQLEQGAEPFADPECIEALKQMKRVLSDMIEDAQFI